jgi:hypothetical protein
MLRCVDNLPNRQLTMSESCVVFCSAGNTQDPSPNDLSNTASVFYLSLVPISIPVLLFGVACMCILCIVCMRVAGCVSLFDGIQWAIELMIWPKCSDGTSATGQHGCPCLEYTILQPSLPPSFPHCMRHVDHGLWSVFIRGQC